MFDYIAVSATMTDRAIEYVDHFHEHFEHPVVVRRGRYLVPAEPGYSIAISAGVEARIPVPGWRDLVAANCRSRAGAARVGTCQS